MSVERSGTLIAYAVWLVLLFGSDRYLVKDDPHPSKVLGRISIMESKMAVGANTHKFTKLSFSRFSEIGHWNQMMNFN